MPAPPELKTLVKRYEDNWKQYSSSSYKEAELRKEFLNPLFELLGWDVYNKKGRPEQYKEVVDEPSLEVEGGTKAPDYAFRLGEVTKFYVEAKKPSVKITTDPLPAFQLKRYAWSAKLPLSILTNFEDISVYDCRFKPEKTDSATKGRILHIDFQELEEKWDELVNIFSPEAIWQGSFDKYIDKKKRGTSEVDTEILKEIEGWREELAKNIALRNPDLTIEEMNFAVQRLIDRILFLRICEDRGTEKENQLVDMLERQTDLYKHLFVIFQMADTKYNSGLFHLQHDKKRTTKIDRITPFIKVDDKVIASIIWDLYYPRSPYQFDVIPADILGHVYEQFLGKVIRLTAGHRAKVEEKPEVKKAGGVYYTPTYIVDYIVENTVVKLCDGKSLDEMASIKILDPACGSGSFLIVAYKKMLDMHLKWYGANKPKKHKDQVFLNQKGAWQLTLREKKRILLNNIHGVDIDSQAVEVTKLNLMLKALEGESMESVKNISKWFGEPALPDLGSNIKCGNSLIDFDIIDYLQDLDEEEQKKEMTRINPFNWESEFPDILGTGGFDTVIGNPPYGAFFAQVEKSYIKNIYKSYKYKFDSYIYFTEMAIYLCSKNGFISFITPEVWLRLENCVNLRRFISNNSAFEKLRIFGEGVFEDAVVNTVVYILRKDKTIKYLTIEMEPEGWKMPSMSWKEMDLLTIDYRLRPNVLEIVKKIKNKSYHLEKIGDIIQGLTAYDRYQGQDPELIKRRAYHLDHKKDKTCGKWLAGKNITRYHQNWSGEWLSYGPWLAAPRESKFFEGERILFREVPGKNKRIQATYVKELMYYGHSITPFKPKQNIDVSLKFILGIVNSKLLSFYADLKLPNFGKNIFPKLNPQDIKNLPICNLILSTTEDKAQHDKMVKLAERMLKLHKDLPDAKTSDAETRIQRQIDATDKEIDKLVYELYGLTEEEIGIVEGEG